VKRFQKQLPNLTVYSCERAAYPSSAIPGQPGNVVPDIVTTVTAIVGVVGMIFCVAIGALIVLSREPDE
jgi:hypothetical protein